MKSFQIRSFFWSVLYRIQSEYGPEITPYLDTFHTVFVLDQIEIFRIISKNFSLILHRSHRLKIEINENEDFYLGYQGKVRLEDNRF